MLLWLLRHAVEARVVRLLLLLLVAFNGIEAVILGFAGAQRLALPVIFANVGLHALVAGACAHARLKQGSTGVARDPRAPSRQA